MEPGRTEHQRRTIHYRGTVQGVGFRYTTVRIASRFEVTGYVQNLPDGRVLIAVEGKPAEIDQFLVAVSEHLGQYVVDTHIRIEPAENRFHSFEIRF